MKPKLAAALLANNNQFLVFSMVNGVKGKYDAILRWYEEVYQYSRHLSMMVEIEVEAALKTKDPKIVK